MYFEPVEFKELKHMLLSITDKETVRIRFNFFGNHWRNKIENFGYKKNIDLNESIVI